MGLKKSSEQRIGPGSASMFEEEFLEIEVTVWGAGGPRAVCGESANTNGEREAGCEEPALLPSPSATASCSLPPAGATAAVGTWPWSLRRRRGGAGAQGEAELGAGLGARGTPPKPPGRAVMGRGGAGREE